MSNLYDLTRASLSELREYEWLWRSPVSGLPSRQRWYRILDRIFLGQFSRLDLDRGRRESPGIRDTSVFFAWVCSSIEVNNRFAEAYGWRSISGNELFCDFGKIQRLQGWDRYGEERYYDVDFAVIDSLIANALRPSWDWTVRVCGTMTACKAIRVKDEQKNSDESLLWMNFAQDMLYRAISLAKKVKNRELIAKTEILISDLDHWSTQGSLPKNSELGQLYD
ncbi:MAG TPA: hypothetical protein PKK96_07255 [Anaerolineales bacterium]|nr:hypothetical protein [Anaerolineales bacterium]HNQ95127.1 hypothetical protein [Anaerolineales bacterium]HNS60784.1 hypothetical protein [Anaerolineales bacterium]